MGEAWGVVLACVRAVFGRPLVVCQYSCGCSCSCRGYGGGGCTRISDSEASLTDYMHMHDKPQKPSSLLPLPLLLSQPARKLDHPAQHPSTRLSPAAPAYPRPAARYAQTRPQPPTAQKLPAWSMSPGSAGPARIRASATGRSGARGELGSRARRAPPAPRSGMRPCRKRRMGMRFSGRVPVCGVGSESPGDSPRW